MQWDAGDTAVKYGGLFFLSMFVQSIGFLENFLGRPNPFHFACSSPDLLDLRLIQGPSTGAAGHEVGDALPVLQRECVTKFMGGDAGNGFVHAVFHAA